jgi:hypothetical protein
MARWLVTIRGALDPEKLRRVLEALNIEPDDDLDPIPSNGDHVVEVEGPDDLPARAERVPEVRAVHPCSEMTLY